MRMFKTLAHTHHYGLEQPDVPASNHSLSHERSERVSEKVGESISAVEQTDERVPEHLHRDPWFF